VPHASVVIILALALALPVAAGSCGRTACITVTAMDLVNGVCPSAAVAQARFADPTCGGNITSVDGAGSLDDGLCCYPVSEGDGPPGVDPGCSSTATDTEFPDTDQDSDTDSQTETFFGVGGSGGGGTGGSGSCAKATCASALAGSVPFSQVCGAPTASLDALVACACAPTCLSACSPTLCVMNAPDDGCLSCLETSCASQLATCQSN
jgi:hypothetical protein